MPTDSSSQEQQGQGNLTRRQFLRGAGAAIGGAAAAMATEAHAAAPVEDGGWIPIKEAPKETKPKSVYKTISTAELQNFGLSVDPVEVNWNVIDKTDQTYRPDLKSIKDKDGNLLGYRVDIDPSYFASRGGGTKYYIDLSGAERQRIGSLSGNLDQYWGGFSDLGNEGKDSKFGFYFLNPQGGAQFETSLGQGTTGDLTSNVLVVNDLSGLKEVTAVAMETAVRMIDGKWVGVTREVVRSVGTSK